MVYGNRYHTQKKFGTGFQKLHRVKLRGWTRQMSEDDHKDLMVSNTTTVISIRQFLSSQGDVYHLVFELGEWLDGRVWPSSDELEVLRLVDFIEHVTGGNRSTSVLFHLRCEGPLHCI